MISLKIQFNRVDKYFSSKEDFQNWISLFKLFVFVLILSHIIGIMWYLVAVAEINAGIQNNWIYFFEL
jgi:hypothetical protein